MRFGNVEFNDRLMSALRDDNLVVFAGAGVSIPSPSNLPSFHVLLKRVQEYFKVNRNDEENVDQFLGRLEMEGQEIRAYIVSQLKGAAPNQLHRDLLDIRPRWNVPRLVTTNFDRLFEATEEGKKHQNAGRVYTAPALPPGGRFNGIVNLHGVIDRPKDMVLTDSDIGRAYLEERWALNFLQALFETQHILFVGYSHQDPIVRYLARAMPTTNEPARRFILTQELTVGDQSWHSLGIEPIAYQNHEEAAEAIGELAEYQRRSPSTWHQMIAQIASQPNPPLDTRSQNIVERALQDPELMPAFTSNAQSLRWIEWCIDKRYAVGAFDGSPIMENHPLLTWLARLLAAHDPDQAIATTTQAGQKLHPQLWWDITQRLLADGHTRTSRTISRWVSYLLSASPADMDTRKPDGLYRLSQLCIQCELYQEAANILDELFRPVIRAQPRRRAGEQVELTTLGETWMLSATWATMSQHMETVAAITLDHAVRHIENRHRALAQWGGATAERDTDSSGRHLIGDSQGNRREAGIDQMVNIARDCLEWTIQNEPELVESWLDRLIASQSPLARRLAVHSVRMRPDQSADEKAAWLSRKAVPMDSGRNLETEQLLIQEFKDLSDDWRRRVVDAINDAAN